MNRSAFDWLFRVDPPWIYVGHGEPDRGAWNPSHYYSREDLSVCVRRLRGQKMRNTLALMDEFAAALQFFDGFGENWYALEECLGYLDEWLPAEAYVLVVDHADELLLDEGIDEMTTLLRVLHSTGEFWAKPIADGDRFDRTAKPFHVLLNLSNDNALTETQVIKAACQAAIPLRH